MDGRAGHSMRRNSHQNKRVRGNACIGWLAFDHDIKESFPRRLSIGMHEPACPAVVTKKFFAVRKP
jgi:hypothetical protein